MKAYWDSSALVEAAQNPAVRRALRKAGGITRPHALAEIFSTLTAGRLGYRCEAEDATRIAQDLAADLEFVELDANETLQALSACREHGVRGGLVHDFLHAQAAAKARAPRIFTLNESDFRHLRLTLEIGRPPGTSEIKPA